VDEFQRVEAREAHLGHAVLRDLLLQPACDALGKPHEEGDHVAERGLRGGRERAV
jgi:hypothetical protein